MTTNGEVNFKRNISAPCAFMACKQDPYSHKSKMEIAYPAVDCSYGCDACGWNPEEKARRLKEGKWKPVKSYRSAVDGSTVFLKSGTKQLVFRQVTE